MLVAAYALIAIGTACLACGLFVLWLGSLCDDRDQGRGILDAWNEDLPAAWGNSDAPATTRRQRPSV